MKKKICRKCGSPMTRENVVDYSKKQEDKIWWCDNCGNEIKVKK